MDSRTGLGLAALVLAAPLMADPPRSLALPRASGPILLDGGLDDAGWQGAAVVDRFYETAFGDNREPIVETVALLAYDERYLYVGLLCRDPQPGSIRAPFADRDEVIGTQDNVAVFLDTRNDGRSALELRVNPRGIQGDAVFNDASANEDFSPDFYYDTAARITETGWQAEMRVPLSSLRYPDADPQSWGLLIWRNYPRAYRYGIYSSPLPAGSNCLICHALSLTGIGGLPSSSHLVLAPYASARSLAQAPQPGAPLQAQPAEKDAGLDLKWQPGAQSTLDLTLNPDFSQIEADVAQIAVNNRFSLFFPEKRPFFLEGVDLLDTPIQALYTRTLTSPRAGLRATGKSGASAYTFLAAEDRGGGSVVLPGPLGSSLAPQDFSSWVGVGRWRRDLGRSFVGALATAREIEGGGHNRVLGPDLDWRPNDSERVALQVLFSDTETPRRPDLAAEWTGEAFASHAATLQWFHSTRAWDWSARASDVGEGFRADVGFVPQVGYRELKSSLGRTFLGDGLFSRVRVFANANRAYLAGGGLLSETLNPAVQFSGRRNLFFELSPSRERLRTGGVVLTRTQLGYTLFVDPSRRVLRVGLQGFLGEDVDLENARVGRGGELRASATLLPTDHLGLDLVSAHRWLNVARPGGGRARLFTAQVQRLKATYNASARLFVRLIAQQVRNEIDPALYREPRARRSGGLSVSGLLSYKLNWQTALFAGYGDERALAEDQGLSRASRQFFFKLSYAFQR